MEALVNLKQLVAVIQLILSLGLSIETVQVEGFEQQIYTIVADPKSDVVISQRLSEDQVYGFEKLSDMGAEHTFGVNGMFYDSFGHPAGISIIDSEVVTTRDIGTPLFAIQKDGTPMITDIDLNLSITIKDKTYQINEVNGQLLSKGFSLYTPWNGTTDRIGASHSIIVIHNNKIVNKLKTIGPYATNKAPMGLDNGDFLAVFQSLSEGDFADIGDSVDVHYNSNIELAQIKEGFQTGGWLVQNGINVAKPYENYIGRTDSLQPRTAIGITEDNRIMVKVIDGRQTGVSVGVTGKQLADLFIKAGCVSAAYLDGGASTTLVKKGKLLNSPSLGEEKKISHGVFFDLDYSKVLAK